MATNDIDVSPDSTLRINVSVNTYAIVSNLIKLRDHDVFTYQPPSAPALYYT